MSYQTVLIVFWCLLLTLFGCSKSASNRRCLPIYGWNYSFCFTQPDPPVALSWYEAQRWCKNINATLPIPDSYNHREVYEKALPYFDLQKKTLWLAANATYDPKNWFWTDGSRFTGSVEDRYTLGKTHAYVMRNGTGLTFISASPSERNSYICQLAHTEATCAQSLATIWINGRCFRKDTWQTTWYSFMYDCVQSNSATYDDLQECARWLDKSTKFWIGLRSGWWSWNDFVTGKSIEILQIDQTCNLPNPSYGHCLAANQTLKSPSKWVNMDCDRPLQFICQQRVVTSDTQTPGTTYSPHIYRANVHHPLAIGLGVGLGVLFLALTVCTLLAVCARRRKRDSRYSTVNLQKLYEYCKARTTSDNSYDNYAFKAASGAVERHGTHYPYKPLNPAANEYVY